MPGPRSTAEPSEHEPADSGTEDNRESGSSETGGRTAGGQETGAPTTVGQLGRLLGASGPSGTEPPPTS